MDSGQSIREAPLRIITLLLWTVFRATLEHRRSGQPHIPKPSCVLLREHVRRCLRIYEWLVLSEFLNSSSVHQKLPGREIGIDCREVELMAQTVSCCSVLSNTTIVASTTMNTLFISTRFSLHSQNTVHQPLSRTSRCLVALTGGSGAPAWTVGAAGLILTHWRNLAPHGSVDCVAVDTQERKGAHGRLDTRNMPLQLQAGTWIYDDVTISTDF